MSKKQDTGKCACRGCGATFGSLKAFDAHRVGPFTARRCLPNAEMLGQGFRQGIDGRWRLAGATRPAHWGAAHV